jgi:MFS family permease
LILAHLQPLPLLVFYLMTVFTLSWATLGYSKFSINAVVFGIVFAFFIPVSALIADRIGRRKMLIMPQRPSLLVLPFLFLEFRQSSSGDFVYRNGFDGVYLWSFGTFLSELFPTNIRYSTSLAFNMAGIIGAALRL